MLQLMTRFCVNYIILKLQMSIVKQDNSVIQLNNWFPDSSGTRKVEVLSGSEDMVN